MTKYADSISSIAPEVWTLSMSGSTPQVAMNHGGLQDRGLSACMRQVQERWPHIKIGLCGSTGTWSGSLAAAAADPAAYIAALKRFVGSQNYTVSEIWTDFEVKSLKAAAIAGVNQMHALTHTEVARAFRYAGCEPRDPPYFAESCSAFAAAAPGVMVQASNTYWSTAVSSGWYKGFETLLDQEIAAIGEGNIGVLSPSLCPACATGADANDNLTMAELYHRMDIMCAKGISDVSVFTFFELVQGPRGTKNPDDTGKTISDRYFEALKYFRTGKKS